MIEKSVFERIATHTITVIGLAFCVYLYADHTDKTQRHEEKALAYKAKIADMSPQERQADSVCLSKSAIRAELDRRKAKKEQS